MHPGEQATQEDINKYTVAKAEWDIMFEEARQYVDRIAFCGQVPVNVTGAVAGQYIVPVANADGSIGSIAVSKSDMSLDQYLSSVGKVINVLEDGRAYVIVKV
jgi:hypothetical protein